MNEDQNKDTQVEQEGTLDREHNEGKELQEQIGECSNCKEVSGKLKECERQRDEYLNGWQRAKADFVNYKKEESNRLESVIRLGNEELIKDMISVLDSFELGMVAMRGNEAAEKGLYMIRSQCEEVLKRYGLEKVNVEVGVMFDPSRHEAVGEISASSPPNAVAEVVSYGYMLNGRIIRPAKVKISSVKDGSTSGGKGPEETIKQTKA